MLSGVVVSRCFVPVKRSAPVETYSVLRGKSELYTDTTSTNSCVCGVAKYHREERHSVSAAGLQLTVSLTKHWS